LVTTKGGGNGPVGCLFSSKRGIIAGQEGQAQGKRRREFALKPNHLNGIKIAISEVQIDWRKTAGRTPRGD